MSVIGELYIGGFFTCWVLWVAKLNTPHTPDPPHRCGDKPRDTSPEAAHTRYTQGPANHPHAPLVAPPLAGAPTSRTPTQRPPRTAARALPLRPLPCRP